MSADLSENETLALRMQAAGYRLKDVGVLLGVSAARAGQITRRAHEKVGQRHRVQAQVERQAARMRVLDEAWQQHLRPTSEWHVQQAYLLLLRRHGRDVCRA